MVSFYGGRRGASVEIMHNFDTVTQMNNAASNYDYGKYVFCTYKADGVTIDNGLYRKVTSGWERAATIGASGGGGGGSATTWTDVF